MEVIELRNERALLIPDIQNLLRRAVESGIFLAPGGFDSVALDIWNFVTDERQFLLLGAEKGAFRACAAGYLPAGNLFPYPTVVMFYNEGSRALSRALSTQVMDFVISHGYTRLLACNTSGGQDEVWQKALTPKGAASSKVGSLVLFEVD